MTGSVVAPNQENFERALVHPMFEYTLQKVFAMDRTLEIQHSFKHWLLQTNWLQFTENPTYLTVDESIQTFTVWCSLHGIVQNAFVNDMWTIMAKTKPKQNLMFLEGVLNSGKSFIARSVVALFKYNATIQGTTTFPFMELAQASVALIEEPVFTGETLQTFKKLAEGTPTDVSVKNKASARVPRLPILITANYPFWHQGGSTERDAFRSSMIHYKLNVPAPFLKITKRQLNPAMWKVLWADMISPNIQCQSSSDEDEFREYLKKSANSKTPPAMPAMKRKTPSAPTKKDKKKVKKTLAFMDPVESICKSDTEEYDSATTDTDIDLLCAEDINEMP